jgi:hypothetical protein
MKINHDQLKSHVAIFLCFFLWLIFLKQKKHSRLIFSFYDKILYDIIATNKIFTSLTFF